MAKKSETLRQREQAQRDLLELKKMQMGQIDPASLPKEEPIVPKTLEEKKQNFLYYHKYKVIVAVAVAAVLSFLIYSGVTATKYDAKTAIFCYRFMTTDQASAIGAYLENYYPDMNENGKVDVAKLRPITYDSMNHHYLVLGEKVGQAFHDGTSLK